MPGTQPKGVGSVGRGWLSACVAFACEIAGRLPDRLQVHVVHPTSRAEPHSDVCYRITAKAFGQLRAVDGSKKGCLCVPAHPEMPRTSHFEEVTALRLIGSGIALLDR